MKRKVDLIYFRDNIKGKPIIKYLAFMNCDFCGKEILLETDRPSFCPNQDCRRKNKFLYKLKKDERSPYGFSRVLYVKVNNFQRKTIMEAI